MIETKKKKLETCKSYPYHKYRVFQNYFGKFYDTIAICDVPDKDTAELIIKVFTEYHKDRPFEYFLKKIKND